MPPNFFASLNRRQLFAGFIRNRHGNVMETLRINVDFRFATNG